MAFKREDLRREVFTFGVLQGFSGVVVMLVTA